jgi:hypothetical protein
LADDDLGRCPQADSMTPRCGFQWGTGFPVLLLET